MSRILPTGFLRFVSALAALSVAIANAQANGSTSTSKAPQGLRCAPGGACASPVSLNFLLPLFLSNHDFKSTAVLVNSNSVATYVDVTVRDANGEVVIQQRVAMAARNHVQIDISQLLDSAHSNATRRSVLIAPATDGTGIGVIGQMSIAYSGSSQPSYLEYEPAKPNPGNSLVLRGVADAGQASPIVGITSVTPSAQNVTIQCFGADGPNFSKTVSIPPMGTLVAQACSNAGGDPIAPANSKGPDTHPQAKGISLTTDAPPGSFAAVGFTHHQAEDGAYFTAFQFSDPKGAKTSTTIFPGLPVGSATLLPGGYYLPELSVANFSSSPAHVTVTYSRTAGDTPQVKTVDTLVVPAGRTATANLPGLQGDPNLQNSFEVVSDQPAGEVLDKISSRSGTGIRWVELPGKDMDSRISGGNHPWTVADGTDSTILLFNQTASAEDFIVLVSSGQTVWTKKYTLDPLATRAIDINELIQDQVKDNHGYTLPRSAKRGQANWFETRQFGGAGRLLQSNPAQYAARSFSCGEYIVVTGGDWQSGTTTEGVGQVVNIGSLLAQESMTEGLSCGGTYVGESNGFNYSWSSLNTSIANISGQSSGYDFNSPTVQGVSPGTATIQGYVSDQYGCGFTQNVSQTVCGVTVPYQYGASSVYITAKDCSGSQTTSGINAQILPSPAQCPWNFAASSCTSQGKTGNVDLGGSSLNSGLQSPSNPQCVVTYYAGPGQPGSNVGTFVTGFSINIGGSAQTAQGLVTVQCPSQ